MYEPGSTVVRYCDIFPAKITPWEEPLPVRSNGEAQSVMLRVIVLEGRMTIGYQWGQQVSRLDLDFDPEETAQVSLGGGLLGKWTIGRKAGCRCNARLLAGWDPYPGVNFVSPATLVESQGESTWGLIPPREPVRYSRPW